ncbi:MAG: serine/threonine-protein kinase [Gemmatimonadales bacterium]
MSDELLERLRTLLAPRYEVYHELGRGGMGIVYLGRHVLLDKLVAIKVLDPRLATALGVQRFLREPRMLAKLSHPNIVHVYDTSDDSSELSYYVMEYLEGETLEARIARGKLQQRDVAAIGRDVLAGLQFAQERGIIHRDIKPSNIFLVPARAVRRARCWPRPPRWGGA